MNTLTPNEYHSSPQKRALDITLSSIAIPLVFPVEVSARSYLRSVLDEGDDYFRQDRLSMGGEFTEILKLRTMLNEGPDDSAIDFSKNNPRIPTGLAKGIRDLGIDELPQVRQVLLGDMTLVGPRQPPQDALLYREQNTDRDIYRSWRRLCEQMKGGITGPAQVAWIGIDDRSPTFLEKIMLLEIEYILNGELRRDISLINRTAVKMGGQALKKVTTANTLQRRVEPL